jgi:hypothetical protein
MPRRAACIVLAAAALALAGFAPAGQPNPKRLPALIGPADVHFAMTELCFPWVRARRRPRRSPTARGCIR